MSKYLVGLVVVDVESGQSPATVFGQLHTTNDVQSVTEDLCHALEDEGCRPIPTDANKSAADCAAEVLSRTAEGIEDDGVVAKNPIARKHQLH